MSVGAGIIWLMDAPVDDLDARATAVLDEALSARGDFPGWLGERLAVVAARHGTPQALIAGVLTGSWEAELVLRLAGG